jgi:hypothetical protein
MSIASDLRCTMRLALMSGRRSCSKNGASESGGLHDIDAEMEFSANTGRHVPLCDRGALSRLCTCTYAEVKPHCNCVVGRWRSIAFAETSTPATRHTCSRRTHANARAKGLASQQQAHPYQNFVCTPDARPTLPKGAAAGNGARQQAFLRRHTQVDHGDGAPLRATSRVH